MNCHTDLNNKYRIVNMYPNMLRTLIIEDEIHAQNELRALLSRQPGFVWIGNCASIKEASLLIKSTEPDLILLDIQLEDGNAFELLQSLKSIPFKIIFITAFSEHALRAIKFSAIDYLVKPLDEAEFAASLKKVLDAVTTPSDINVQLSLAQEYLQLKKSSGRIALRDQNHLYIISYDDILYCQSHNGYTTFYLTDNKQIVVSRSIKEHEQLLLPTLFIRIHQSYIVNIGHVELYHKEGYILLKNKVQLPVSARKKEEVIKLLTS